MQVIVFGLATAWAAPVVWLTPPPSEADALVNALPTIDQRLTPSQLIAAGHDDATLDQAYRRLEDTLRSVRQYETKLDGELIIMTDLQAAIDGITGVRDDSDLERLFKALAYQGFAVDRYFAETLATDDEAAAWRTNVNDTPTVGPWAAAAALHPSREISSYDISETPQRIAYESVQQRVVDALPGGLRTDVSGSTTLWVDGEQVDTTGTVLRLPPGRHYVELRDGTATLTRQRVDLEPGGAHTVAPDLTSAQVEDFVAALPDSPIPPALQLRLDALGGEVFFATTNDTALPTVWAVDNAGAHSIVVEAPDQPRAPTDDGLSFGGTLQAGWLASGDFYTTAFDVAPNTRSTVNSAAMVAGLDVAFDKGLFRIGIGIDALFTPGAHHTAHSGQTSYRVRPAPHAFVGTRFGGITGGFLVPYHPFVGLRGSAPITPAIALTADARLGLPGTLQRPESEPYTTRAVYSIVAGVTFRLHP